MSNDAKVGPGQTGRQYYQNQGQYGYGQGMGGQYGGYGSQCKQRDLYTFLDIVLPFYEYPNLWNR
jgi:hypothetical protein